jgi:hypothetical protein
MKKTETIVWQRGCVETPATLTEKFDESEKVAVTN